MTMLFIILLFIMLLFRDQAKQLLEAVVKLVVSVADALTKGIK